MELGARWVICPTYMIARARMEGAPPGEPPNARSYGVQVTFKSVGATATLSQ
jgi:hypothetical protein